MANGNRGPTAMRRRLGEQLKQLRLDADMTSEETAVEVGFSDTKINRIEKGQYRASREDVIQLTGVYGLDDAEMLNMLLTMVKEGGRREWWESHLKLMMPKFNNFLGLEASATVMKAYETHLVPGILQTPDYARAAIKGARPELLEHQVSSIVDSKMRRKEVLTREDPPPLELWAVMDEGVLRREIGGKETMGAQLEYLIEASELPNVTIQVIPNSKGAHAGLDGPMSIFEFETGSRPAAYTEGQAGNLYMEKDHDLQRCQQRMTSILVNAPNPQQSLDMIRQIAKEMKP